MANQESAIKRAIAHYGASSKEARDAYNDYVESMEQSSQRPLPRERFGVK